jgi:tetratricopeptide (TPR) repeat protein
MTNQPKGAGFIREGTKETEVELKIQGSTITRLRGKQENTYQLDGRTFRAFGNDVPEEIAKFLNVGPLNFQGQHDPPFWFTETAGEVSRQLNQIVDLGAIDSILAAIDSSVRKSRGNVELIAQRRDDLKAQGQSLVWARRLDKDLKEVEALWDAGEEEALKCSVLKDILERIEVYEEGVESAGEALLLAEKTIILGNAWQDTAWGVEELEDLIENILKYKALADTLMPPSLNPIQDLYNESSRLWREVKDLRSLIEYIEGEGETLCQKEKSLKESEEAFKKIMGKNCLLCGAKIRS